MKKALIAFLLLLMFFAGWVIAETFILSVEHVDIPIEGLPSDFAGFRIVQLSDLHGRRLNPAGREARAVREAEADIIVITGDFVSHSATEIDGIVPFLQTLSAAAPVYAVSGNHDYWTDWPYIAEKLEEAGVKVLQNEHTVLRRGEARVILAGVNDPFTGHGDLAAALPEAADTVVILLAHAPTWFFPERATQTSAGDAAEQNRQLLGQVSLTLAGHTHGGQIKLPFLGALTTASGQLFPRTHVEGLSREENSGWLYINRGLGQVYLPVRFLSRAEITVINLYSP